MTEVRASSHGNLGLFATKAYQKGDLIFSELPLLSNASEENNIQAQFTDASFLKNDSAAISKLVLSKSASSGNYTPMSKKRRIGKWREMIAIAASFAIAFGQPNEKSDEKSKQQQQALLSLYFPSDSSAASDPEKELIQIAELALEYCITNAKPASALSNIVSQETSKTEVFKVMLIWACNAFEGGLLYENTCRINHSCDPNCLASPPKKSLNNSSEQINTQQQVVTAIANISPGDELFISYLGGIYNWTGGIARQNYLLHTRHFLCNCPRCSSGDTASAIPCPSCHPRSGPGKKYLDEDIQWDDDENIKVSYANPKNASCDTLSCRCKVCNESTQYNSSPILKIGKKVVDKVMHHIDTIQERDLSASSKLGPEELASINTEIDEQLHQLSSSVLGANHWTTNIMLLSLLDRTLASFNAIMLLGQDLPDMSDLAEAIDSLQRLWKFSSGLGLKMDSSFLLHNQTLGIARALVALGDVKSMKYGAEWAEKVENYFSLFEGEDMKKVVVALKEAWKRPVEENAKNEASMDVDEDDSDRSKKRVKK